MIPTQGFIKNYHWGKTGSDNYIARFQEKLHSSSDSKQSQVLHNNEPLAELWFGSHPSGTASIKVNNQEIKLDSFLAMHPEMVGDIELYKRYNKRLPFLFKLLSIDQPLSLQAHPDKNLAEILHKKDAKNYPDSNHKPELAIALTDFQVLCDFRPVSEIVHFMTTLEPLTRIVGAKKCEQFISLSKEKDEQNQRDKLAECFKSLMTCKADIIVNETKELVTLINSSSKNNNNQLLAQDLFQLILELDRLYPGDPGVFAPFFLNYLTLTPGQAVYLKANKLHAYIKGECIECMASSDNVVRAGLTTKFRDVDTLINMLNYKSVKSIQDILFKGSKHQNDQAVITYAPTEEFKVDKCTITQETSPNRDYTLSPVSSGSFFIVLKGKANTRDFFDLKQEHKLTTGSAGFVPPKIAVRVYNIQSPLIIYRAYC